MMSWHCLYILCSFHISLGFNYEKRRIVIIESFIKIFLNKERKEKVNQHFFYILLNLSEVYRIYLSEF